MRLTAYWEGSYVSTRVGSISVRSAFATGWLAAGIPDKRSLMRSVLKRIAVAAMLAVTVMVVTMPLGQASTNPVPPPSAGVHQDLSTQAAVDAYFKQHPGNQDEAAAIKANVTLTKDGYFATTSSKFAADVQAVNAGMRQFRSQAGSSAPLLGATQALAWWCFYIPGWVFRAYVYFIVIAGGVSAIVAVFASLTVAGLVLGAILAVLGISAGLYAWMLDQVFTQRGYYNHGVWACL
jgi:hypothetical protein